MTTYFATYFDGEYHILRWHNIVPITLPERPPENEVIEPNYFHGVTVYTSAQGIEFVKKMIQLRPEEKIDYNEFQVETQERTNKCEYYAMVFNLRYIYGTEFPVVRSDLFEAYHEALKNRGDKFIIVSNHIIHTDKALVARFNNHVRFMGDISNLTLSDNPPEIKKEKIKANNILGFWTSKSMPLSDILDEQFVRGEAYIWGFTSSRSSMDFTSWFKNGETYTAIIHMKIGISIEWLYYLLESQKMTQ